MVSSASSSSFNDEESSSPTFERKADIDQEPLWRKKENPFKKKLNGNLPPGKKPEEEKLLTNGNYLTNNADGAQNQVTQPEGNVTELEMEQMREESDSNTEVDADNKTTRV